MPVVLLSPAKTLDETPLPPSVARSEPRMTRQAAELVNVAKKLTPAKIKSLMGVSDAIAKLNYERFQCFDTNTAKQCAHAFDGPAYRGFDASTLSAEDLAFSQTHIRILCGLYGVLRPLDAIKPYRLEMGCKLENAVGKNLYSFWGESITDEIAADLATQPPEQRFVVNCASQEYFKSVRPDVLNNQGIEVYTCVFPGPSVHAKQARGAMCRHVVLNRVTTPEGLKSFTGREGEWRFDERQSKGNDFVFVRGVAGAKGAGGGGTTKAKATKTPPPTKANKAKAKTPPAQSKAKKAKTPPAVAKRNATTTTTTATPTSSRKRKAEDALKSPPAEVTGARPPARRSRRTEALVVKGAGGGGGETQTGAAGGRSSRAAGKK